MLRDVVSTTTGSPLRATEARAQAATLLRTAIFWLEKHEVQPELAATLRGLQNSTLDSVLLVGVETWTHAHRRHAKLTYMLERNVHVGDRFGHSTLVVVATSELPDTWTLESVGINFYVS